MNTSQQQAATIEKFGPRPGFNGVRPNTTHKLSEMLMDSPKKSSLLALAIGLALFVCGVSSAMADTYYIRGSCSVAGDGTSDGCASSSGGTGAWKTITNAAEAPLRGGDVVKIHAGTYTEKFWPKYGGSDGNPIIYESFGDGDVIFNGRGVSVPQWTGQFYLPAAGNVGFVRNINNLTIRGKPGSYIHFTGGPDPLMVYANSDRANGNNLTFQYLRVHDVGKGGVLYGSGFKIENSEFYNNGVSGLWVFAPASNFSIRKSKFYNNGRSGGNTDGLTIQDVSFALLEDLEIHGQYDGLDIGSQGSSPGVSFVIVRRVKSYSNVNTNFPSSTTVRGPLCYQYTQQWDNYNWGSTVSYEGSRNIEYWNSVYDDVLNGVSIVSPASGARFVAKNNIFRTHHSGSTMPGTTLGGGAIDADYNRVISGSYDSGVSVGSRSSTGDVNFADRAGRDYRLTSNNPALIDQGAFFTSTSASGSNTLVVPTAKDPRTYFFPGDTIQIEGAGVRTVASLSASAITLTSPATFASGRGVHLPWNGARPDIGAYESGESAAVAPPPPPAPGNLRISP